MSARRWPRVAAVALVLVGVVVAGRIVERAGAPTPAVAGPGDVTITLTIHHSHFDPGRIRVAPGTNVRFVVVNEDPINHELIVGDAEVHRRHEAGTEPVHPPRPGEVSVAAETTAETTFRFDTPGSTLYACHLPGHFRYGMSGWVDVVAA